MAMEHLVKSYDEELKLLDETVAQMGGLTETQIASALQAVVKRDSHLAGSVVEGDERVDELENKIESHGIRLLALRQPMAGDLRTIVSALRVASDLERIADHAANIAKRGIALAQMPPMRPMSAVPRLGRMVQHMVKEVLDAYMARDAKKAMRVWEQDEELDEAYTGMFREALTYMMEDPRNIGPCTHLLFIGKNIERMGDHATNIAESVYYLIHGQRIREARPKGDTSDLTNPTYLPK